VPGPVLYRVPLATVSSATSASVVLLDIEGTTTPIDFVYKTLFPFARARMEEFVHSQFDSEAVQAAVKQLEADHAGETESDVPSWANTPAAVTRYALWLMDRDRKATGLKSLQGIIWKAGYDSGELKATLYDDVAPAIHRWTEAGKRVCIYSSGSILAQKLLFAHTVAGDLTGQLSAYFDTTTGPKREAESYRKIAEQLGVNCGEIFFLSDSVPELDAATEAGCGIGLAARGDTPENPMSHPIYHDFAGL
jgi:enolase-phosphatase E1